MLPVSLEDVQGHDPRGTVRALLALTLCPLQSMRLLSGKAGSCFMVAGAVRSRLHGLKCITERSVEIGT